MAKRKAKKPAAKLGPKPLSDLVPTNWLDSLLTGPEAVLHGSGPWHGKDIERLLLAVRDRIRAEEAKRGR